MNPLSICMVIARFPPYIGGTEIQCARLSRSLAAHGHRVVVITEQPGNQLPAEEMVEGIRVIRLRSFFRAPLSWLVLGFQLLRRLRSERPFDIFHGHMLAMPALALLWKGKQTTIPTLVKIAGADKSGDAQRSQRTLLGRIKFGLFRKWSKHIACPSTQAMKELLALGIDQTKIHLIPNGVDSIKFIPPSMEEKGLARRALHLGPDDFVAIYAGRPAAGKGVDTLLNVWTRAATRPEFRWKLILLLAAEGELLKEYEEKLKDQKQVLCFFNQRELLPYYQCADLALLLSRGEGLSNFLLEAMACGLPHMTTPNASISEDSDRTRWSWVIPLEQIEATAFEQLLRLQGNGEDLKTKGTEARTKITQFYSMEKITETYEQLYRTMIGPR